MLISNLISGAALVIFAIALFNLSSVAREEKFSENKVEKFASSGYTEERNALVYGHWVNPRQNVKIMLIFTNSDVMKYLPLKYVTFSDHFLTQ